MNIAMNNCSRNTPCIDCDNTNCVFQGKKESDCPKWHCDRPDYAKLDCDHCGFIDKFIEDMREMYNSELRCENAEKRLLEGYGIKKER